MKRLCAAPACVDSPVRCRIRPIVGRAAGTGATAADHRVRRASGRRRAEGERRRGAMGRRRPQGEVRRHDQRRRRSFRERRRSAGQAAQGRSRGMRAHPRHRERGARHPRRRADALAREPADDGAAHPRMAGRHRHGPPAVRLPSRITATPACSWTTRRSWSWRRSSCPTRRRRRAIRCSCTTRTTSRIPKPFTPSIVVGIDAVGGEEVAVRRGDAVAVRRRGLVAGADAPRRAAGRPRAAAYLLDIVKKRSIAVADQYRERLVALYGAGARRESASTRRRSSWGSTDARRRSTS